jgi:hypothetical protein
LLRSKRTKSWRVNEENLSRKLPFSNKRWKEKKIKEKKIRRSKKGCRSSEEEIILS